MALGDRDDPFTHRTFGEGYKWCRCSVCGEVHVCTPSFDFYVEGARPEEDVGKPLICETCFRSLLNARGTRTDLLAPVVLGDPS